MYPVIKMQRRKRQSIVRPFILGIVTGFLCLYSFQTIMFVKNYQEPIQVIENTNTIGGIIPKPFKKFNAK